MQLKHDCVRAFLLTVEEEIPLNEPLHYKQMLKLPRLNQFSHDDIVYTILRLDEAGYINASILRHSDGIEAFISSLTYNGHLFLDNIRDDGIWKETKSTASKLASVSLNILAELASSFVKQKLGLS